MVKIHDDNRGARGFFNHVSRGVGTVRPEKVANAAVGGSVALVGVVGAAALCTLALTGAVVVIATSPVTVPVISIVKRENPMYAFGDLCLACIYCANCGDVSLED